MTDPAANAIVRVRGLSKQYATRDLLMRRRAGVQALRNVDLEIAPGKIVAVVGESGSGKSTLARCIAQLEHWDDGQISFRDKDVTTLAGSELRAFRREMQLILQDSAGALNPRFTAMEAVEEPLVIQSTKNADERRREAVRFMERVGLPADWADRRVTQFSGGQRQRLAIARALILRPKFLILDEALSGLDLSTQAQVLNLLLELQDAYGLTYLFVSHDLTLIAQVADEIAVMHGGEIVERAAAADILNQPKHPQTIALVNAATSLDRKARALAATGAK
jgi:ABC-type glutathione transport system ATPase component